MSAASVENHSRASIDAHPTLDCLTPHFANSERMATALLLQPALWQTCRIVANRLRLKMFGLIVHEPGQTVSILAKRAHVPIAVASQYLRALEACGLLAATCNKRSVEYRAHHAANTAPSLATALTREFENKRTVETVFKLVTAFTHPRRIEIYRSLAGGPQTLEDLVRSVGVPPRALLRHLSKLTSRGFILHRGLHPREYAVTEHPNSFARALAEVVLAGLAANSPPPQPKPEASPILFTPDEAFID